uniref:Uncharacterized protein n=1 Tax=Triticum urartu TaxID=4572 RepID=A0A8R7P2C9_TRIUA
MLGTNKRATVTTNWSEFPAALQKSMKETFVPFISRCQLKNYDRHHLTSRIHRTQSWSSSNFWLTATFRKTRILPRNCGASSLHRNDPPQLHCSDTWAAFTCLHRTHTRSCRW